MTSEPATAADTGAAGDPAARTRSSVGGYDEIAAAAARATGLDDFGGRDHETGLRILVDDLNAEAAGLTGIGNYQLRAQVRSALVARLLSQDGFGRHPEYAEQVIRRPVFVVGLPRSGTTALHRLLTADARHQGVELWLTEFPRPRPDREARDQDPVFAAVQQAYAAHWRHDPEFMGLHHMDAAAVDECWRLLRQSGTSIGFESVSLVPRYSAWLAGADWRPAYRRHKANLQLIGLGDERRWVLKNPSHLAALDALMAVYPDALVVVTHRDPIVAVASACSLSARASAGWSTTFTGPAIGRSQLELLARCRAAFEAARPQYPGNQFLDVEYDAFVADPVGTVRRIYRTFDLGWTPPVAAAVAELGGAAPRGPARPAHTYDLADYGLSPADVRDAFAAAAAPATSTDGGAR